MKAILDTSVLIASDVAPLEGELAISAAALAELHFGVLVTSDPATRGERLRRLSEVQRRFTALPVDDAVNISYGRLAAAVVAAGRRVDPDLTPTGPAYPDQHQLIRDDTTRLKPWCVRESGHHVPARRGIVATRCRR